MLALRLELLTGRYVASEYNNRKRAEWPPHPARVFSALVAAYYEGGQPADGERALRWLERLPAPQLCFSTNAARRDVKTHFVPVNDKALGDSAQIQKAWVKVYEAKDDKARAKAQQRLAKAYGRTFAEAKSLSKNFLETVQHVLPATRTKQPRTFPSVTPEDPVIHLVWDKDPEAPIRAGLDAVAAALVRVGHSSSLVTARWIEDAPEPTWVPHEDGDEILRWVRPGQLDALDALHEAEPFGEQRVMPFALARYRASRPLQPSFSTCFARHFVVLRRVDGPRLPIEATEFVADAVRRALMSHAEEPTPSLISGHGQGGVALQGDHLAVVPLPYVGGRYANGELLGVALVPPAGLELEDLQPLYAAIARWEAALGNGEAFDEPRARLTLGRLGAWTLERCLDIPPLHNLREATWTRGSKSWVSATPMILDRHPGSFREDRQRAEGKARATIWAACQRIGLPTPLEVELSPSPFLRGSVLAKHVRRRPGKRRDSRPRMHVRLRFEHVVNGPVLLGAGRYRGLGLFRPVETPEERDD